MFGSGDHSRRLTVLFFAVALLPGCAEKPIISGLGKTEPIGGVVFSVGDYKVRLVEVTHGMEPYEYQDPVLAIPVTIEYRGEGTFTYSPTHHLKQVQESTAPLLYKDPGTDKPWETEKSIIDAVFLEKGFVSGQLEQSVVLNKGDSVTDLFLFGAPVSSGNLILSLPPSMHGGAVPVLIRFSYEQQAYPEKPKAHSIGEEISIGSALFSVQSVRLEYGKILDQGKLAGFTNRPILKAQVLIKNAGEKPISYTSPVGVRGRLPTLNSTRGYLKPISFAQGVTVDGQLSGTHNVAPGKSVTDSMFFVPPSKKDTLTMTFPGKLFGEQGLARVSFPYEPAKVKRPKELSATKAPAPTKK
jgi:hypothetical protein